MPKGLIDSPLDFLFADHHRQRQAVTMLLAIADGAYDEKGTRNLIQFLEVDFAFHISDEERDFVPLLRRRCKPVDRIDELIDRLATEHRDDESSVAEVVRLLKHRLEGTELTEDDRTFLRDFAAHLRRHLALENGVLLPIARVRMDADSLKTLSERMKARRRPA